jgi:hypothetical protein
MKRPVLALGLGQFICRDIVTNGEYGKELKNDVKAKT